MSNQHDQATDDEQYWRQLADWVVGVLEQFPPLTPAQRDRLAVLLAPCEEETEDEAA